MIAGVLPTEYRGQRGQRPGLLAAGKRSISSISRTDSDCDTLPRRTIRSTTLHSSVPRCGAGSPDTLPSSSASRAIESDQRICACSRSNRRSGVSKLRACRSAPPSARRDGASSRATTCASTSPGNSRMDAVRSGAASESGWDAGAAGIGSVPDTEGSACGTAGGVSAPGNPDAVGGIAEERCRGMIAVSEESWEVPACGTAAMWPRSRPHAFAADRSLRFRRQRDRVCGSVPLVPQLAPALPSARTRLPAAQMQKAPPRYEAGLATPADAGRVDRTLTAAARRSCSGFPRG